MEDFIAAALLGSLVWKFTDFLKFIRTRDVNGGLTQLAVWIIGIGAAFLVGETQFAASIPVGADLTLENLDGWDKVVIGVQIASAASVSKDFSKAIDNSDSAKTPSLF